MLLRHLPLAPPHAIEQTGGGGGGGGGGSGGSGGGGGGGGAAVAVAAPAELLRELQGAAGGSGLQGASPNQGGGLEDFLHCLHLLTEAVHQLALLQGSKEQGSKPSPKEGEPSHKEVTLA